MQASSNLPIKTTFSEGFQLSLQQSKLLLLLATDLDLIDALNPLGLYLRNSISKKRKAIPATTAVTICLQRTEPPHPLSVDFSTFASFYHGLVFIQHVIDNPSRGFHRNLLFEDETRKLAAGKLDSAHKFEKDFDHSTMLSDFRWFVVEPDGQISETFALSQKEIDKLLRKKFTEQLAIPRLATNDELSEILKKSSTKISVVEDASTRPETLNPSVGADANEAESSLTGSSTYLRLKFQYEGEIKSLREKNEAQALQIESQAEKIDSLSKEMEELKEQLAFLMSMAGKKTPDSQGSKDKTEEVKKMEIESQKAESSLKEPPIEVEQEEENLDVKNFSDFDVNDFNHFLTGVSAPVHFQHNSPSQYLDFGQAPFSEAVQFKESPNLSFELCPLKKTKIDPTTWFDDLKMEVSSSQNKKQYLVIEDEKQGHQIVNKQWQDQKQIQLEESKIQDASSTPSENKESLIDTLILEAKVKKQRPKLLREQSAWDEQLGVLQDGALTEDIVDGYLSTRYEHKQKKFIWHIFESSLWPLIEQHVAPLIDFQSIQHKELLIFPMLVSLSDLRNETSMPVMTEKEKDRWICIVIRNKTSMSSAKRWYGSEVHLEPYIFDTSGTTSKVHFIALVSQLLGYISDSVLNHLRESCNSEHIPEYVHPIDKRRTVFECELGGYKMTVPLKSSKASGVSMLDHIDKIIANPQKYLDKKIVMDTEKTTRGTVRQIFINFFNKEFPVEYQDWVKTKNEKASQTQKPEPEPHFARKKKEPVPKVHAPSTPKQREKPRTNVRGKAKAGSSIPADINNKKT